MITIVGSILFNIITAGLLWYSEVKSNERLKKEISGRYRIKANFTYKISGFLLIIVGILLINVMILNWNDEIKIIAPVTACFFLIPGIFITMFYYNFSIEFNDVRIIITNWRGSKKAFKWDELIKVKFIRSLNYLYLKTKNDKILINKDSVGFVNLIEMIVLKTNYKIY